MGEKHMPELEIPSTEAEIRALLRSNPRHDGLNQALLSIVASRSPNTATILLLGLSGAGKSTTVNSLFKDKRLAVSKGSSSGTTSINFYETQLAIEETKCKNVTLRIIDTPGFGDTEFQHMDARVMAGLQNLFETDSNLKGRLPNIVCIVMKFIENRYSGENSTFIKMLKGLSTLKEKLFDENHSNIVIILTHFMSGTPNQISKPEDKCREIEMIVRRNLKLSYKCVKVVIAENKTKDYGLTVENGYAKLPNGEYYPYNLLEAMKDAMVQGGDIMGNAIVTTAFKDVQSKLYPQEIKIDLPDCYNHEVQHLIRVMHAKDNPVKHSEVNRLLQYAWEKLNPQIKSEYPTLLETIQRFFESKEIFHRDKIPENRDSLLQLLTQIPASSGVAELLQQGFGLKIPNLSEQAEELIGRCYHCGTNMMMPHKTIFAWSGVNELGPLGYLVPSEVKCELTNTTELICKIYKSKEEYARSILQSYGVEVAVAANIKVQEIGGSFKVANGHNIVSSETHDENTFNAVYECRTFKLVLHSDLLYSDDFILEVNRLPKFDKNDQISLHSYQSFFEMYGTHVIQTIFGGGAIEMIASKKISATKSTKSDQSNSGVDLSLTIPNMLTTVFNLKPSVGFKYENGDSLQDNSDQDKWNFIGTFKGGDRKFHTITLDGGQSEKFNQKPKEWEQTLGTHPTILQSKFTLSPIHIFVHKINTTKSSYVREALVTLFGTDGTTTNAPEERKDIKVPTPSSSGRWCSIL